MTNYYVSGTTVSGFVVTSGNSQRVCSGGSAVRTTVSPGGRQLVYSEGVAAGTTVSPGGRQLVYSGGTATGTKVCGGVQHVWKKGVATGTAVSSGGSQNVYSRGTVSGTEVCGGVQYVWNEGVAIGTAVSSDGSQNVYSRGKATGTTVSSGSRQNVDSGGTATGTKVSAGGWQHVWKKGMATGTTVSAGGWQAVYDGGTASGTTVSSGGAQYVNSGGTAVGITQLAGGGLGVVVASNTVVSGVNESGAFSLSGGVASNFILFSRDWQYVDPGGTATGTTICGGVQYVDSGGKASATTICGGLQYVDSGGTATGTTVSSGGQQYVYSRGKAYATKVCGGVVNAEGKVATATVQKGGVLNVKANGKATGIALQAGGSLAIAKGGTASTKCIASGARIALKAGGTLNLAAGDTLYGAVSFSGATVAGGSASNRVNMAKGAKISIGAKTNMKKLHLDASNAILSFTGAGSTLGSLMLSKATKVSYDVSKLKAKGSTLMLSLSAKNTQKIGAFSVTVAKGQAIGAYELSKNLVQNNKKGMAYTVNLGSTKLGTAKLNSTALTKNGVTYSFERSDTQTSLVVAMKAGSMKKGNAKANSLKGSVHSDVFYGGNGNDTIKGVDGRDVAVYDKTVWGKDKIVKTNGTMTILFKDLKKANVVQKLNSKTNVMTITRKDGKGQSINVQGWNSATHGVVFASAGSMESFDKWLKASTTARIKKTATAARTQVWQNAGLAQA